MLYDIFSNIPLYYHIIPGIFILMPTFLIQTFLVVVFKAEKDKTRSIKILFISNLVLFIMPFIIKKMEYGK